MGLRFDPVGGGQFKAAAQAMIDAEAQPLKALNARKGKEETRLKLFQEFKTKFTGLDKAISEISSFRKFRELKVDLGDGGELMSTTLQKEIAEPGRYEFEISELAARGSCISNGFQTADQPTLGAGFISLPLVNNEKIELYIDENESSLQAVARQINRTANATVRAAVVKDASDTENPWKMILTSKKEGAQTEVEFPELYFLNGEMSFQVEDDRDATNASIRIDGFPIELESNDTNDFFPGVNIHLKQARPDRPFTLTISEDYQKMAGKMKAIVDQVNQILQFIQKQNAIDQNTDTTTSFAGDGTLQGIELRIRNMMHGAYSVVDPVTEETHTIHLNEIGVEFDRGGALVFKEDKFNKYLEKNFELIAQTISGPGGFAEQIAYVIRSYTRPNDGLLSVKESGIRARIKQVDEQINQKNRQLDQKKQAITDKFARLEGTIGNLQKQQQYMAAALPAPSGGSSIAQLLG